MKRSYTTHPGWPPNASTVRNLAVVVGKRALLLTGSLWLLGGQLALAGPAQGGAAELGAARSQRFPKEARLYGPRVPKGLLCDPSLWRRSLDGGLCDLARSLALALDDTPRGQLQSMALELGEVLRHRAGVFTPHPAVAVALCPSYGAAFVALQSMVKEAPQGGLLGLAFAPRKGGPSAGVIGVVLRTDPILQLRPFPRIVPVRETAHISFSTPAGSAPQAVFLQAPQASQTPISRITFRTKGDSYELDLPPLVAGMNRLEIMIDRGQGPEVGLLAELFQATQARPFPRPRSWPTARILKKAQYPEATLFAKIEATRRARGLGRVRRSANLDTIASARAKLLSERHLLVHRPRGAKDAKALLREAGISFAWMAETLALGPTTDTAYEGLLQSPAHLDALLDARATELGIGAVRGPLGLTVAIVLIEPGPRLPRGLSLLQKTLLQQQRRLQLRDSVNQERRIAKLGAAKDLPQLDDAAQALSDALARSGHIDDPEKLKRAQRSIPMWRSAVEVVVSARLKRQGKTSLGLSPHCPLRGLGTTVGRYKGELRYFIVALCAER